MENNELRNCGFQFYQEGSPIIDECELTLSEAKKMFDDNYNKMVEAVDFYGLDIEVVIWVDMEDKYSYGKKLLHLTNPIVKDGYLYSEYLYLPFDL